MGEFQQKYINNCGDALFWHIIHIFLRRLANYLNMFKIFYLFYNQHSLKTVLVQLLKKCCIATTIILLIYIIILAKPFLRHALHLQQWGSSNNMI